MTSPKCSKCGSVCWVEACDMNEVYGECGGERLHVSENYPDSYVHWCEKHKNPDDMSVVASDSPESEETQ